jgi:hexosaminidase
MGPRLSDSILLPRPREIRDGHGAFRLRAETRIVLHADAREAFPTAQRLQAGLAVLPGTGCTIEAREKAGGLEGEIRLALGGRDAEKIPPQGYAIGITPEAVSLSSPDAPGLFYAAATLLQIIRQTGNSVPCGSISDSPDFPVRGVMLDISRDKVPTMETLFALVELLAGLKVNQLQLYTEHTFAYARHKEVWAGASPMTGEEILLLDSYCRERYVELVPNQNSFGHMHRWLALPRYRGLAECPDGFTWPWGATSRQPFTLDPSNPGSFSLLEELYAELLPHFSSRLFNAGCDETFDLGQGKSRERCAREGKGRVYLDFLFKIHELVKRHGRTMMFWGDIVMQHPELVGALPRDAIALEWGYEADHPFAEHAARLAASGIPFYVCPGTSSWNSVVGRTDNCLTNIRAAARAGLHAGAAGCLTTDWGDDGHWQPLPVSYLGFAAGAALSWCVARNSDTDFTAEMDLHVFRDSRRVMGKLVHELGNVHEKGGWKIHNESFLFHLLQFPDDRGMPDSLTEEKFAQTRRSIESIASGLAEARMDLPDSLLIRDEYANAVRLLLHACDRGLALRRGTIDSGETRARCAADLRIIIGEYSRLWMARNRIGGLSDSVRGLERLLERTGEVLPSAYRSQM